MSVCKPVGRINEANKDSRYLKVVTYHFSSVDPLHQGCAAHGSNDELAAKEGSNKLLAFREAVKSNDYFLGTDE